MALTHTIIETRPYLAKYLLIMEIADTVTSLRYIRRSMFHTDPTLAQREVQAVVEKGRIQNQIDLDANSLNLTTDEDVLLNYYQRIKIDIVLRIRQYPAATLQQASDYIDGKYPDSPFDFSELYQQWLRLSNSANWAAFKQFCIDHRFTGIGD